MRSVLVVVKMQPKPQHHPPFAKLRQTKSQLRKHRLRQQQLGQQMVKPQELLVRQQHLAMVNARSPRAGSWCQLQMIMMITTKTIKTHHLQMKRNAKGSKKKSLTFNCDFFICLQIFFSYQLFEVRLLCS